MTTIQESASTSGNSAPAEQFDETHLNNLIAAIRIELRERAVWMKQQTPDATMYRLEVNIEADTEGQRSRPMFTASVKLQSGEFLCKCEHGSWADAHDGMMVKVREARAFDRFKKDIGYVPKKAADPDYWSCRCGADNGNGAKSCPYCKRQREACEVPTVIDDSADTLSALIDDERDKQIDDRRDAERERRDRLEIEHQVGERFDGLS